MIIPYWLIVEHIFPNYFTPLYIGLVFEIWASSLFLLAAFRRRRLWGVRIASGSILMLLLAVGLGFLRNLAPDSINMKVVCNLSIYVSTIGLMFFFFEEKPIDILLCWTSIIAIREAADGLDTMVKIFAGVPLTILGYNAELHYVVNGLIFDLIHLAVQLPLGFLFARYKSSTKDRAIILRTVVLSFTMAFVTIVVKSFMVTYAAESKGLYGSAVLLTILLSLLILLMRTDVLIGSQKSREIEIMNAVLDTQQKQFEDSKQSIALINAKVHDIKHRIDDFGDKVAADTLNELKSSVEIYDRPFHTGSQVLDTILYTKSLECDALGIRLSAIGDAKKLHFIPSSKRFYLFSNIIDNAIEAAREVEDKDKRVIGISLGEDRGVFRIEEYNYFQGARTLHGGTLFTTKKDARNHGLGLRSIHSFAEEWGGKVEIEIKEDMFFLTVSIPLTGLRR
ncbi:MAG: GHKL domain-containing protein [Bacilli bacterium]|nr:GHKL domain-containing protein [Bacilli bacterium]